MRGTPKVLFLAALAAATAACAIPIGRTAPESPGLFPGPAVEARDIAPFRYAGLMRQGAPAEVRKAIQDLVKESARQGLPAPASGPFLLVIHDQEAGPDSAGWEIGLPIPAGAPVAPPLQDRAWELTRAATARHVGPAEEIGRTAALIQEWMKEKGLRRTGPVLARILDKNPLWTPASRQTIEVLVPCGPAGPVQLQVRENGADVLQEPAAGSPRIKALAAGIKVEARTTIGAFYEILIKDEKGATVSGFVHRGQLGEIAPPPPPPAKIKLRVVVARAVVRQEPALGSPVVRQLEGGTVFDSPRQVGDFYQYEYRNAKGETVSGFIHKGLLERLDQPADKTPLKPEVKGKPMPLPPPPIQPQPQPLPSTRRRPEIELGVYGSLANTYARGNVDDYFAYMTDEPGRALDQGSPAFAKAQINFYLPTPGLPVKMGVGLGFAMPPSHSLWGTYLYFGGRDEMVVNPFILNVSMPVKLGLNVLSGFFLTAQADLLLAMATGYFRSGWYDMTYSVVPSLGFGFAGGADWMITRTIGISFKAGLRQVKAALAYADSDSDTGYTEPYVDGKPVRADLSGAYVIFGAVFIF